VGGRPELVADDIHALLHARQPAFAGVVALAVRVRSLLPAGPVNYAAWVEDPTGSMPALLLRSVVEDAQQHEVSSARAPCCCCGTSPWCAWGSRRCSLCFRGPSRTCGARTARTRGRRGPTTRP
jgi:hypothetical protein